MRTTPAAALAALFVLAVPAVSRGDQATPSDLPPAGHARATAAALETPPPTIVPAPRVASRATARRRAVASRSSHARRPHHRRIHRATHRR